MALAVVGTAGPRDAAVAVRCEKRPETDHVTATHAAAASNGPDAAPGEREVEGPERDEARAAAPPVVRSSPPRTSVRVSRAGVGAIVVEAAVAVPPSSGAFLLRKPPESKSLGRHPLNDRGDRLCRLRPGNVLSGARTPTGVHATRCFSDGGARA